jgi:hypothetical protein
MPLPTRQEQFPSEQAVQSKLVLQFLLLLVILHPRLLALCTCRVELVLAEEWLKLAAAMEL